MENLLSCSGALDGNGAQQTMRNSLMMFSSRLTNLVRIRDSSLCHSTKLAHPILAQALHITGKTARQSPLQKSESGGLGIAILVFRTQSKRVAMVSWCNTSDVHSCLAPWVQLRVIWP